MLLEQGADHVTAARVAEVADVARTTIYRHWPDSGCLLLATIDDLGSPHHEPTSEGDLATDVRLELGRLSRRLTQRKTRLVFNALASHASHDATFAAALENFITHLGAPMRFVLDAAIERGQLDDGCDCAMQASVLVAPILHRHFMLQGKPDDALIEATAEPWLAAHAR